MSQSPEIMSHSNTKVFPRIIFFNVFITGRGMKIKLNLWNEIISGPQRCFKICVELPSWLTTGGHLPLPLWILPRWNFFPHELFSLSPSENVLLPTSHLMFTFLPFCLMFSFCHPSFISFQKTPIPPFWVLLVSFRIFSFLFSSFLCP